MNARWLPVLARSTALALLLSVASGARADGLLGVIDIEPILARHDVGNSLGVAYNPDADIIYLSHGSDARGGFIYTLDTVGNLLGEFDFQAAYRPGTYPTSLQYDRATGHLFVQVEGVGFNLLNLVEIAPDGSAIFSELTLDLIGHPVIRDDGIWQSGFQGKLIRHYSRSGEFIEDVPVRSTFPGSGGPDAMALSFRAGFFVVDLFGRRLVEMDTTGRQLAAASLADLGRGLGFAISTDPDTDRIFLSIANEAIYVLADSFLRPVVNELVSLDSVSVDCAEDLGPCSIRATFTNTSSRPISDSVFLVTELSQYGFPITLANADGGLGTIGSTLTPDVGDGSLVPSESFEVVFEIVAKRDTFRFFVDLLGDPMRW